MTHTLNVLKINPDLPYPLALKSASDVIQSGGVIVYPTETLYGIGADALNAAAIRKVFAVKQRLESKPLLVIANSRAMVETLTTGIPEVAIKLMDAFWPGPLTIVFKAGNNSSPELTQGNGTIGVRIPSSKLCLDLVAACGRPLVSTSANLSGSSAYRNAREIAAALGEGVDLYIDAGELPESKPSTVVSVAYDHPILIREGVITFEALQSVVPDISR